GGRIAPAAGASPRVLLGQVNAPPHTTRSPSGFTAVSGTEPSFVARRSIDPAGIEPAGIEPAGIEPAGSEALAVELAAIVPTPVVPSCPAIATPNAVFVAVFTPVRLPPFAVTASAPAS